MTDQTKALLLAAVGESYALRNCWELVRYGYQLEGLKLPADYYSALPLLRVVPGAPEPLDIVVIQNHAIVTNHVGLYLGAGQFIHTMEDVGVTVGYVHRRPWDSRIRGFLRLRT